MTRRNLEDKLVSLIGIALDLAPGSVQWMRREPDMDWETADGHEPLRAGIEWQRDDAVGHRVERQADPESEADTAALYGWRQMRSTYQVSLFAPASANEDAAGIADRIILATGGRPLRVAERDHSIRIAEAKMSEIATVRVGDGEHESRAVVELVVLWTLTAGVESVSTGVPALVVYPYHPTSVVEVDVPIPPPDG